MGKGRGWADAHLPQMKTPLDADPPPWRDADSRCRPPPSPGCRLLLYEYSTPPGCRSPLYADYPPPRDADPVPLSLQSVITNLKFLRTTTSCVISGPHCSRLVSYLCGQGCECSKFIFGCTFSRTITAGNIGWWSAFLLRVSNWSRNWK